MYKLAGIALSFALLILACSTESNPADITVDALPDTPRAAPDITNDVRLPGDVAEAPDLGQDDVPPLSDAPALTDLPMPDISAPDIQDAEAELVDLVGEVESIPDVESDLPTDEETVEWDDVSPADLTELVPDPGPGQPPQACGMAPYDWLPVDQVGDVLTYEEQFIYNLPPALIEELVGEAGYSLDLPLAYTPRVFKMRYTTQDKGKLAEATAMVGFPDLAAPGAPPTDKVPAAVFLHGTTGYANQCAPSNGLEGAAAALLPAAAGLLAVAPDYIGLCGFGEPCPELHPYLVGEPTAVASLDAVRAALKLRDLLDTEDNLPGWDGRVAAWGASQGGHAALFVDRYAPYYAPEFEMPCVVAVVPPANLAGQAGAALTKLSSAASLGIAFLVGAHLWYAPDQALSGLFNPDGPKDYSDYAPSVYPTTCNAKNLYKGAASLSDIFVEPALDALVAGNLAGLYPWGCMALENSLPTTSLPYLSSSRLLFLIGENDNLVDDEVEQQTFLQLCDEGYVAEFVECAGLGHTQTALESVTIQLEWLFECLEDPNGVPSSACKLKPPQSCKLQ